MIGAFIGDIVESCFEFNNYLSRDFNFITGGCQFTDDTVMTCAMAQALMNSREDFSDLRERAAEAMQQIGRQFPNCGYGARFWHWIFTDNPQLYGNYRNGSAMCISLVGFVAGSVEEAKELSAEVTCVFHNYPRG